MWVGAELETLIDNDNLSHLAGNAFDVFSCAAVSLIGFAVLGARPDPDVADSVGVGTKPNRTGPVYSQHAGQNNRARSMTMTDHVVRVNKHVNRFGSQYYL